MCRTAKRSPVAQYSCTKYTASASSKLPRKPTTPLHLHSPQYLYSRLAVHVRRLHHHSVCLGSWSEHSSSHHLCNHRGWVTGETCQRLCMHFLCGCLEHVQRSTKRNEHVKLHTILQEPACCTVRVHQDICQWWGDAVKLHGTLWQPMFQPWIAAHVSAHMPAFGMGLVVKGWQQT